MKIQITGPQHDFVFSVYKYPGIIAGYGSGKSEAGIKRLIHLASQERGLKLSHSFPTYKLAKRRGLYGYVDSLRAMGIKHVVNKQDMTVNIIDYNALIYLDSYSDPDLIIGYEVAHAVIDELDTLPFERAEVVYKKITARVRQNTNHIAGNTVAIATTPDNGEMGYCFKLYGRGEYIDNGFHYIRAGTGSNPFISKDYVEQLTKGYDDILKAAFIYGEWVNFTKNKVYYCFKRIFHHSNITIQPNHQIIHIGQDFNVGGCVSTVFIYDNNVINFVDEFVSQNTHDLIIKINNRYIGKTILIYPDASGNNRKTSATATDIQLLRQAGFDVRINNRNPFVRDRINSVNTALNNGRVFINTDKCQRLTHALESQGYDDKGEPEKYNNHPSIDDFGDSFGYPIAYLMPIVYGSGFFKR